MEAGNDAEVIVNNEISATVIETEIETLKSIFITELEVIQSERQTRILTLNLEPATADNKEARYVCLTLHITVPETYPDDLPTVVIKNPRGLSDEGINRIMKDINSKSELLQGNPMLFELIDVAKEYLTFCNLPRCQCAICLYDFSQEDIFTKTECYHYFHSHCLTKFVKYSKEQFEEDQVKGIELCGMVPQKFQAECPVCRLAINFQCNESFPAPSAAASADEPFQISEDIREIQEKLASLYENQKAKGGIIDLEEEKNKYLLEISSVITTRITLPTEPHVEEELAIIGPSKKRPELKNAEYLKEKLQTKMSDAKSDVEGDKVKNCNLEEDVNTPKVGEEQDDTQDNKKDEMNKSPTGSKQKVRTQQQDRRPNNNYNNRGGRYGGGGYNNYNDNYRRPPRGGYNQYNNRDNRDNRDWYGNNRRNYNRYPNNRDYNDYYDGGRPQRSSNQNKDTRRVRQDSDTRKLQLNEEPDTQDTHLNGATAAGDSTEKMSRDLRRNKDEQNDGSSAKLSNKRGSYRDQRPRNNNPNRRQRDSHDSDYRPRKESVNSNDKDSKDLTDDKSNELTSPKMERMARSSPNRRNRFNSKNSTNSEVEEVARNVDSLNSSPPQNDGGNSANKRSGGGRGGRNFRRGSNKSRNKVSPSKDDSSMLNSLNKDFEEFVHEFKEEKSTRNSCDQSGEHSSKPISSEKSKDESISNPDNDFAKNHEENRTISNHSGKSDDRTPPRRSTNNFRPPPQNRYNGYNNSRGGRQQFPRQSRPTNYRRPGNYDYQDRESYNRGSYNSYNRVPTNYNYGPRSYRNGDSRGGPGGDGYQHNQSPRRNMDKPRPNLGNVGYSRDANSPKIRHPEAQFHPPGIPVMKPVVTNQSMGESDI